MPLDVVQTQKASHSGAQVSVQAKCANESTIGHLLQNGLRSVTDFSVLPRIQALQSDFGTATAACCSSPEYMRVNMSTRKLIMSCCGQEAH